MELPWSLQHQRLRAVGITFFCYTIYSGVRQATSITKETLSTTYAPFNDDDAAWGTLFLGLVDFVYLASYAAWQFVVTKLVLRWDLNLARLAAFGLAGSGVCLVLMGAGGSAGVHSLAYFLAIQTLHGAFQACGWISCLTVTIRWLDPSYRLALALGLWNAHSSIGSIVVKVLGSRFLLTEWSWTGVYYGLGVLTLLSAVLVWCTLDERKPISSTIIASPSSPSSPLSSPQNWYRSSVLVWRVACYCVCYFFAKIVSNLFGSWLPYYLSSHYDAAATATAISAMYDVGGVCGGIGTGFVCDYYDKRRTATTSVVCFVACAPLLGLFVAVQGAGNAWASGFWMLLIGVAVQAPCSLVSSVVVADLKESDANHDPRALATMTGLVNGAGSIGSATQAIAVGLAAPAIGWDNIFYALIVCCLMASAPLLPSAWHEVRDNSASLSRTPP